MSAQVGSTPPANLPRAVYSRIYRAEGWPAPAHGKPMIGERPLALIGLAEAKVDPSRLSVRYWTPRPEAITLPAYTYVIDTLRLDSMRAAVTNYQELRVDGRVFAIRCQVTALDRPADMVVLWLDRAGDGRFSEIVIGASSEFVYEDLPEWARRQLATSTKKKK